MNDNLPELKDIHLPEESLFLWPITYGWWLLAAVVLCTILVVYLIIFLRRKSKKIYALKLLSKLDTNTSQSAAKMSEILRRICVYKYPQASVLFNDEWIQFLNAHCHQKLDNESSLLLLNAPYMKPQKLLEKSANLRKLQDFCLKWIGENL
ncbi:MAG: DUF4381 domain-containing protein [Alphaproteobacteria bacterium]|nr:DUF4381 domain-containing protein [Alphaproteobacteria bacterium]